MGSCHSNCHDAFFFFGGGGECLPTIQGEIPTTSDYKRIVCDELNIYIYTYIYILNCQPEQYTALFRGNRSKLPQICIVFESPQMGSLLTPV